MARLKKATKPPAKKPPARRAKDGSRRGGARTGAGRKKAPSTVATYRELGDAPTDPLDAAAWAFRAQAVALREVMLAENLNPAQRRSEMRTISRAMNILLPKARLRQAELMILGQNEKAAVVVAPEPEAAPPRPPRLRSVPPPAPPKAEPAPPRRKPEP